MQRSRTLRAEAIADARKRVKRLNRLRALYLIGITAFFSATCFAATRNVDTSDWTSPVVLCVCVLALAAILFHTARQHGTASLLRRLHCRRAALDTDQPLLRIVEERARDLGIVLPVVYVTNDAGVSAVSLGRSPKRTALLFNAGLANSLAEDELEAIIVHELHHIRSRDPALRSLLMWSAGFMVLLSYGFFQMVVWGGPKKSLAHRLSLLVFWPVIPFLVGWAWTMAALMRGVFFQQEYLADMATVLTTGAPLSLARALIKLSTGSTALGVPSGGLFLLLEVIGPSLDQSSLERLCRTHPPVTQRLRVLGELAGISI